jgi:hypothetical protein
MRFGRGKGCSFLLNSRSCLGPEFCTSSGSESISYYAAGEAACSTNTYTSCSYYTVYSNRNCRDTTYTGSFNDLTRAHEEPGLLSAAFRGTLTSLSSAATSTIGVRCYTVYCTTSSTLLVKINGANYSCADGATLTDGTKFNGYLTCPTSVTAFCGERNACASCGVSMCVNKNCHPAADITVTNLSGQWLLCCLFALVSYL